MGSSPYGRVSSRSSWERKSKQSTKYGKFEPKRLSLGLLGFCSLILLTFFSVPKFFNPSSPLSGNDGTLALIEGAPSRTLDEQTEELGFHSEEMETRNEKTGNDSLIIEEAAVPLDSDTIQFEREVRKEKSENKMSLEVDSENRQEIISSEEESMTPRETETSREEISHLENGVSGETENLINLIQMEQYNSSSEESSMDITQLGENIDISVPKSTLTCDDKSMDDGFPYARPAICEMTGEITINPMSSLLTLISSPNQGYQEKHVRPYARKDDYLIPKIKEVSLNPIFSKSEAPQCTVTHKVPAVIFSLSGYTGNFFHDTADVLIPLFLTSYKFEGEVQFYVTNYDQGWIQKYRPILRRLSRYNIINLDRDKNVHCVRHAFLGLFRDRDLILHPHSTRNPKNYTMMDFTRFLCRVYGLKHSPLALGDEPNTKPRLLIISRTRTRKISNINQLVKMSRQLGFQVTVSEARGNLKKFAQLVNSCDVMLAVHGAGLTNQIFLPTNAILIQVVPWGKMDWMADNFYGQPAREMGLKYMEYYVKKEESSLIKRYSKDHIVFSDPYAIHLQGWNALANVIMAQDVKLNLGRFKDTLLSALDLLQD